MTKLQKCIIAKCPRVLCPKCHYWYDSRKPHKKCRERPAPARKLLTTCPNCRTSMFGYWGDKTWAERDARDAFVLMLHARFVYMKEHPQQPTRRARPPAVRTTRATNAARTTT